MGVHHWTVYFRRIAFVAMVLVIICAGVRAPPVYGAEESAPNEYIFRVLLPPQWMIADAVFAYQYKGGFYLPAIELAEAYEFYVEAETDRAYLTGFAGREENSFTIDGEAGEYVLKGERKALPPDALLSADQTGDDQEIYVRMDILNEIWPVTMRVDLSSITVYAEPDAGEEELSFVRRKKREERRAILEAKHEQLAPLPDLPYRENAYQWFGKPVLDLQSTYTYNNKTKTVSGSNNISATQQLGKFLADYSINFNYVNGQLQEPDAARARFIRQAVGDEDLLVPTLKHVEFGDVASGQRNLVGNSMSGRGVILSNSPSSKTREFDRITVEGTGPPGWELELYNNGELLTFSTVPGDGEYRFEDVVLNYGNNEIRIIMYGPQGQVREVVEEHQVAGSLLKPGEFRYRAAFVDTENPFVPIHKQPADPDHVNTKNAEFSYGFNEWLTAFGSYSALPYQKEEEQYFTGGLALNTPAGLGEIEAYRQINGGSAIDARFLTELMGVRLNMRSAFFSEFESPDAGQGSSAKSYENELQANTTIPLPFLPISFRLNILQREFVNGLRTLDIDTSQSFTGGGLRFGHGTSTRYVDQQHQATTGDFNVTWNKGRWQTRGAFNYQIAPGFELNNGTAEVRYKTRDNFQAALNYQHDFPNAISTIGGQLGYDFGDILTSLDAQYRQERGWQFVLRASTSLSPYYSDKNYRLASASRRNWAPVRGRVFLDRDGDGAFSDGDEPLPDARLQVNRNRSQEKSDADGYIVTSIRPDEKAAVAVDESSLIDPYYKAGSTGYSTVGLKGSMPGFDFPVVETGAIDGTVWRHPSGKPVSGMNLELVREDGSVYMTAETAFDGYYAFEFVLPGTYTVRADPSYQVNVPTETVTVSSKELFAFGVDLYLLEPADEESAAEEPDGDSGGIAQLPTTAPAVPGTEQSAHVSPQGEGSSLVSGETSDEDDTSSAESPKDGGRSPVPADIPVGGVSSVVKDIRIGEHPDKVRVVLDLTEDVSPQVEAGGEGFVVLVDLPASWDAKAGETLAKSAVLESYGTEALPDGGTRLILRARDRMKVLEHKMLPAANGQGPRFYIDVARK